MKQIVCDLETLGLKPGNVIFSIGLCGFDTAEPWNPSAFTEIINLEDSLFAGFTQDPNTMAWWSQQPDQGELNTAKTGGLSVQMALQYAADWIENFTNGDEFYFWGNSNTFDNEILKAYYDRTYTDVPWSYRQDMDFRTIKNLYPACKPERDFNRLPAHRALPDAIYEADWLHRILSTQKLLGAT